tara:strand:+ start:335 stop:622 length:288 start_codon:yes stop_codon:yes gene_type:complete
MKRLILITISLLLASSLFSEQTVCRLKTHYSYDDIDASIKVCKGGDILSWVSFGVAYTSYIVASYCDQDKQITVDSDEDDSFGVCIYTGKKLEIR